MLNRLKFAALCFILPSAILIASYMAGSILSHRTDQQAALAAGAGYYDTKTGEFRFAVAPVMLDEPMLPIPAKKPTHTKGN